MNNIAFITRMTVAALLLCASITGAAKQSHTTKAKAEAALDPVAARRDIENADQDFIVALKKPDLKAVADAFEEDAILLPPGGDALHGRAAIAKYFADFVARSKIVETSSITLDVTVSGESAYETGLYTMTTQTGDAPEVADHGKYLVVWNRDGDGHWRVARDISNSSVAAASDLRQKEVREKGAEVMPFSLERTQHVFDKNATGGVQRVIARAGSADQVAKIRLHLREIAKAFSAQSFVDPTRIHGANMPGLAELKAAKPGDFSAVYAEIENGGQITYSARTPAAIEAIHRWFDAQLKDHGNDATTTAANVKLEVFSWLAGNWVLGDADKRIEETWTPPSADLMLGMSRTLRGGQTTSFEFARIAARADGVFYIAQPRGKPPVEFPLQSWDGTTAVFVNAGSSDHLKRIVYRHNTDGSMTARVEGTDDGKDFAEDYAYSRAETPAR